MSGFSVAVDPTNPGQFFACCGLLELADRLWPGAEGCFAEDGREFRIAFTGEKGTLRELLAILVMDPPKVLEKYAVNGLEIAPIRRPLVFSFDGGATVCMTVDAWCRIGLIRRQAQVVGNVPWNLWSGQQTSSGIWLNLRDELVKQLEVLAQDESRLLSHTLFQGGRFGFDCGPAWNALDVGFSPNEQKMEVESSPAVELLAAFGIQRFRPPMNDDNNGFDYFLWNSPLPPVVAASAMSGALQQLAATRYRASVVSRGEYAALGRAFPIRQGDSDE